MDLTPYCGIFPAAMTFFDKAGDLDLRATAEHWQWLVDQGADGLVIAGTSGEFISLSIEERYELFRLAVEKMGGKVPLIAGTGHTSTKWTVDMSVEAERIGMDALIVILPYYSKPPMESVLNHYRVLRQRTSTPIMLYNNPTNTACSALRPDQIAQLVEDDVIHMVKSTMESVVPIHDLEVLVGDKMRTFYGSFLSAYEAFAAGAHGWISGVLNVAVAPALQMRRAIAEKDIDAAFAQWKRILPIVHLYTYQKLGPVADIAIYRGILRHWKRFGGFSREPFSALTDEQFDLLGELLHQCDWLPK